MAEFGFGLDTIVIDPAVYGGEPDLGFDALEGSIGVDDGWWAGPVFPELTFGWLVSGSGFDVAAAGYEVGDDGGERVEIPGAWLPVGHAVTIAGVPCYSGRGGEGFAPEPHAGVLRFIVPADLPLGAQDVVVEWPSGLGTTSVTFAGAILVRRRHRRLLALETAKLFPRGPFAAGRGRVRPDQGPVLDVVGAVVDLARGGPLHASVRALGQLLNDFGGVIFTRLRAAIPPALLGSSPPAAAFEAEVETTYGWPDTGTLLVGEEAIPYGARAPGVFSSLTRDDAVSVTYPVGAPVARFDRARSWLERARRSLLVETAESHFLDVIGGNLGVPRYLDADDELYRRMIREHAYQAGRGSPTAIGGFLDLILDGKGPTGVDGATTPGNILEATSSAPFKPGMVDLRIRLQGEPERTYRILEVIDASNLLLDPGPGAPFWRAAAFPVGEVGLTWEIIPWDILPDPWRPGVAVVRINCAQPLDPTGFAYLQGDEVQTADDATHVTVDYPIRQVLGVWLATDRERTGTNYATDNNWAGQVIVLNTPLPGVVSVRVDYGSVARPTATTTGVPGSAEGVAAAQVLEGVGARNPIELPEIVAEGYDPILVGRPRYPLYIGDRLGTILALLHFTVIAGVRPVVEVKLW